MEALDTALAKSGFPGAKKIFTPPHRTLESTPCPENHFAAITVGKFTHETQSPLTLQYVAVLPIPEESPIIVVGKENESRKDLAIRTLEEACETHGCQGNPDTCLFAQKTSVIS